jgi:hypothetical protein
VIGKISTLRGEHVEPLLYYLFGPGRHEEHTDPHIVAGWRHPASLEPALRPDGKRDFATLTGLLRPLWASGAMRGRPGTARCAPLPATGCCPNGRLSRMRSCTAPGCRPAVRTTTPSAGSRYATARITSTWSRCWPARTAASPACPGNGTRSAPPASPPSSGTGCAPPPPPTAPRLAARPARRTRRPPAVVWTKPRGSRCGARSPPPPHQRTARKSSSPASTRPPPGGQEVQHADSRPGHRVRGRAPADTTKNGGPIWCGGGKLAPDLTWPKLRQRWIPHRVTPATARLTAEERNAVWDHATRAAADAAAQIRTPAWTDPAAAADDAWATSDTLHVAAAMLGSRILRQAAATTAPPAHPTAVSRHHPRPGTSSARPPGSCPRSPA